MTKYLKSKFQSVTSPLTGERYMVDIVQELGMEIPEEFGDDHIPQEWFPMSAVRAYFKEIECLKEEDLHPEDEMREESLATIEWIDGTNLTLDDEWEGWEPDDIDHGSAFLRHWSEVEE